MIRLNVNVCRKISDNNYGSRGAGCSLEIELDSHLLEDPVTLQTKIRAAYAIVAAAVADELREGAARSPSPQPAAAAAPARTNGHASDRGSWGDTADHGQAARRGSAPPVEPGDAYEEPEEEDENPPETGRQLLGWASNQEEDAKGFLIAFGKKSKFPPKILDWSKAQVSKAYQAARRSS